MNEEIKAAPLLRPLITTKGMTAAVEASTLGKSVKIVSVGVTARPGIATVADTALPDAVILPVADGRLVNDHQVNVSALLGDTLPSMGIAGIAFYLEDGTMFAVYREEKAFLEHTGGTTLLVGMDLVMDNIPSDSVVVESTGAKLILGDWVPIERRVNGKSLTADIMLNAADVNAAPSGFGLGTNAPALGTESCDTVMKTGWNSINAATTGTPSGTGSSGSILHTMAWNSKVVHQVFYDYDSAKTYKRTYRNGTWGAWKVDYDESNPPPAADLSGYVPKIRKVNSKALDADITLTATDVGAAPASHSHSNYVPTTRTVNDKALSSDVTLTAADVGATPVGFGIGAIANDCLDANTIGNFGGIFSGGGGGSTNFFNQFAPMLQMFRGGGSTGQGFLTQMQEGQNTIAFRTRNNNVWGDWTKLYSEGFKPTAADVGALSLSAGGTVAGQTIHKGLTAFVNEKVKFYEGSGTHHNIQAVGDDLHFSTGQNGEILRMAIKSSGVVEFSSKVQSNYASSRSWTQVGNSAFYSATTKMSSGSLAGLVSGLVDVTGVSTYEHGYGFLAGTSSAASAHALFCNGGGGYNQFWLFRNDGQMQSPNGWLIDATGNLSGSAWSGDLKAWVINNFAPKITNVGQIQSLAFACLPVGQGDASWGSTISGALLRPASAAGNMQSVGFIGTWMCCGSLAGANSDGVQDDRTTLWMRIS